MKDQKSQREDSKAIRRWTLAEGCYTAGLEASEEPRQKGHQNLEPWNPQPPKTLSKRGTLDSPLFPLQSPANLQAVLSLAEHRTWLGPGKLTGSAPTVIPSTRGMARNDWWQMGPGSDLQAESQIHVHVLTSHLAQTRLLSSSKDSFTPSVTSFFSSSTAFKYLTRLLEFRIISAS